MDAAIAGSETAEADATSATGTDAGNEIVTTRVFQAPPELVWQAWTDPEHVVKWWGPRGFTTTINEMDVRPGGVWRLVMHGPDGANYPNKTVFSEVVRPRRIVYRNTGGREGGGPGASFEAIVTLEAEGTGTRATLRQIFASAAERDRIIREFGALEGARQHLERLSEELPKMAASEREFVLTRTLAAPRALVWEAWTDPRSIARWWGPRGFTNPICEMDVRPGGRYRIVMRSPGGADDPLFGEFLEVLRPERLVLTMDASEHPREFHAALDALRPEGDRGKPFRMVTTVTLQEHEGRTLVIVRQTFPSAGDREANVKLGAAQGWGESFERLEALLAEPKGGQS